MFRPLFLALLYYVLAGAPSLYAQSQLPLVEEVDAQPLRRRIDALQKVLKNTLPLKDHTALTRLMDQGTASTDSLGDALQKLLDPHCLVGVHINPESRVKAARGPRAAELIRGKESFILVKIQNDAGVTQGLKVSGEQLREPNEKVNGWLSAEVYSAKKSENKLSGQRLEYVVLRLSAHESGKREATLKFDVGQGTQDLGFRAEVPILFIVKDK